MLFLNSKELLSKLPKIITAQGTDIEMVATYKFSGVIIDQNVLFYIHIKFLVLGINLDLNTEQEIKQLWSQGLTRQKHRAHNMSENVTKN